MKASELSIIIWMIVVLVVYLVFEALNIIMYIFESTGGL